MFRRLLWLLIGAGFGFGLSFWLVRAARRTIERYTPERMSTDLTEAVRRLGVDLREAVAEGRQAMREHEVELRARLGENPPEAAGRPA